MCITAVTNIIQKKVKGSDLVTDLQQQINSQQSKIIGKINTMSNPNDDPKTNKTATRDKTTIKQNIIITTETSNTTATIEGI